MTANLAWRDAMAEVGGAFNGTEQSKGWKESFTPWQVAALQRPFKRGDVDGKRAVNALFQELMAGGIAIETWTETVWVDVSAPSLMDKWWDSYESEGERRDRLYRAANPTVKQKREVTHQQITAADFAAWLATNKIEPSRHVAAWFDAAGVRAAQGQPQQPAPAENRRILKAMALIAELEHEWPSIRADIREASRRGNEDLKAANVKHGHWDVEIARKWADSRGKLSKPAQIHHLNEWPGRVTRNRA
jgi:hypothetical protein